ncbi:unnamed protein product [Protopolystoma xenopodis]|uniref:Uncharacterized protein n=1 Tax=Protopolystoma xenopodis TaxID=117903 RepID=A0A3S5CKB6_9PLAT|nr:unnamed protein product [Protopolystoma xenopodis]
MLSHISEHHCNQPSMLFKIGNSIGSHCPLSGVDRTSADCLSTGTEPFNSPVDASLSQSSRLPLLLQSPMPCVTSTVADSSATFSKPWVEEAQYNHTQQSCSFQTALQRCITLQTEPLSLPPHEGPVTKHLRLTAALTLKNLAVHSERARR